ncbi:hypothetical protein [Spirosoma endbachense]|uniref:Uncharacterized protein n=1 Tax=Spirosoma endbachense TaxID=2666025 RepID=A0A6P1VV27_9BACT|nr:hypothetical protein [Spirosoma endbachense]QHV96278.1 hypothetical protein GJR95_15195 [Spirosoma endbachense]
MHDQLLSQTYRKQESSMLQEETSHLKTRHIKEAYSVYLQQGVIIVLDQQGQVVPRIIDTTLEQPLDAARGKVPTRLTLTMLVNVYDSKEEALAHIQAGLVQPEGQEQAETSKREGH